MEAALLVVKSGPDHEASPDFVSLLKDDSYAWIRLCAAKAFLPSAKPLGDQRFFSQVETKTRDKELDEVFAKLPSDVGFCPEENGNSRPLESQKSRA